MALVRKSVMMILALLIAVRPVYARSVESHASVYGSEILWLYRCNRQADLKIALTFDDGPHPTLTPKILNILKDYGIKATFFVIGENAERYPELIERIRSEGHEIGNHTYSHIRAKDTTEEQMREEILRCESLLGGTSENSVKLFRPPEGNLSDRMGEMCGALDYRVILWSIDTRDWCRIPAREITESVLRNVRSGDIILMHDYIGSNSPTPEALKEMLPQLIKRGYSFVTVSTLLDQ